MSKTTHLVASTPSLSVEEALNGKDLSGVRATGGDVGHDGDHGVLLDVEWTRVERERAERGREDLGGEDLGKEDTEGESDQLSDQGGDKDGRVPVGEELVETGEQDGEDKTDEPCSEGVDGHGRVIDVGDGCSYFWVDTVILESILETKLGLDVALLKSRLGLVDDVDVEVGVVESVGDDGPVEVGLDVLDVSTVEGLLDALAVEIFWHCHGGVLFQVGRHGSWSPVSHEVREREKVGRTRQDGQEGQARGERVGMADLLIPL